MLIFCVITGSVQPAVVEGEIKTQNGIIKGTRCKESPEAPVIAFLGIPYAAPPVGNLRFRRPKPYEGPYPSGIYNATDYGPMCAQGSNDMYAITEDCLYLNVWIPRSANISHPSLPVRVYIHGGGFYRGTAVPAWAGHFSGCMAAYETNAITVNMSYRLGFLGFLALPELAEEDERGSSGNYGLQDTREALRWVQKNIHYFGGDARQVLLHGNSAGASAVYWHMLAPESAGLFRSLIISSGAGDFWFSTLSDARFLAEYLTHAVNCTTASLPAQNNSSRLHCLRSRSSMQILQAQPGVTLIQDQFSWKFIRPAIDGVELLDRPSRLIRKGLYNRAPLAVGATDNDGNYQAEYIRDDNNELSEWDDLVVPVFGPLAGVLRKQYSAERYSSDTRALGDLVTDWFYQCQCRKLAIELDKVGDPPYVYEWSASRANDSHAELYGVYHESDLPYVMGWAGTTVSSGDDQDRNLSLFVSKAWTEFASSGLPLDPAWKKWNVKRTEAYVFSKDEANRGMALHDWTWRCVVFDVWENLYWQSKGALLPGLEQDSHLTTLPDNIFSFLESSAVGRISLSRRSHLLLLTVWTIILAGFLLGTVVNAALGSALWF